MNRTVSGAIVAVITVACAILLLEFSPTNRDIAGVLIFSVILSAPIYVLRRRYERSVTSILERRDEEKANTAN